MKSTLFIASLVLALGCSDRGSDDTGTEREATPTPEALSSCQAADGDAYAYGGLKTSSEVAAVDGDTLEITVGYSGGCENHELVLCWPEQAFTEEVPVGAALELWHNANGDGCEAYLVETLEFDLTPLKEAYTAGYGSETGEIGISIAGTGLLYTF